MEKEKRDCKRKRKNLHASVKRKMDGSQKEVDVDSVGQFLSVDKDHSRVTKKKSKRGCKRGSKYLDTNNQRNLEEGQNVDAVKSKRDDRTRRKLPWTGQEWKVEEGINKDAREVDQLTSVDEDCSRGMKKWLTEYEANRPGLKCMQQQIDEFIIAYAAQQEQERQEREVRVAEGGWTVVLHHKGRKKTTDSESGVTVGSVAQAAVTDRMVKRKNKEVPSDFYRFQKREAIRNEVMMLQSKFEQDKQRIQQLRAARKFRPY